MRPRSRSLTGTIDGADYRVEMPERWNCTLVVYSHGYYPEGVFGPDYVIGLANRTETEDWLLAHGYALAASDFQGRYGAVYEQGVRDQLALLDWIGENIGTPHRTVALGSSSGGSMSVMMAERYPSLFDGAASVGAPLDVNGQWNLLLDLMFTIKTLLELPGDEIELVRPTDPEASFTALNNAVGAALASPQGMAKLALANAVADTPAWNSAIEPEPTDWVSRVIAQAEIDFGVIFAFGPVSRVDLEERAGGNPSWNVGIVYRRQLDRSSQRALVEEAYAAAGLDLDADLADLADAPRVAPDPAALFWLYRYGVPWGTTPTPVITPHNTFDWVPSEQERWYAGQVDRFGHPDRLRQLYTGRATHCAFTAAEEIMTLKALFNRIDTGEWPNLEPHRLNRGAARLGDPYQAVYDFPTDQDHIVTPAFTTFTPSEFLRPSL